MASCKRRGKRNSITEMAKNKNHYNVGRDNPNYGKPAWNRGIPSSPEARAKISHSLLGNKRRVGIPHTEEAKKKISRPGKLNPNYGNGKFITRDGYRMVLKPGHPRARNGRYVCEHLLVAEKSLGRPLVLGKELVHHINGIRTDNRPSNLLICTKSYHYWLHARMAQLYMKEHFQGEET